MAYVISNIELQCIQAAQAACIKCIREQLENLQFSISDGWSMLDGFEWQWQASFAGKLEQAILVPVVFFLIVPLCTAFIVLYQLFEHISLRFILWKTIYKRRYRTPEIPHPEFKTLWCLWQTHGIERCKFGEDHATDLLNQWIVILYGQATANRLDIERCRKGMWRRNIETNMPYYEEKGAPHFHFKNPFDCILEQVSEELPPYQ